MCESEVPSRRCLHEDFAIHSPACSALFSKIGQRATGFEGVGVRTVEIETGTLIRIPKYYRPPRPPRSFPFGKKTEKIFEQCILKW